MENYSYHVPFYVLVNGVATQGYTSDLAGGQLGLYDRQNFAVATSIGQGKELFFAQGALGSKGFHGEPVTESHKSPFFMVKDVENIYVSLPVKIQNEEWVLGYDGSQSSKSLEYVKGQATRIKLYFHGEPVYRMFNGPKEYLISYTPPVDCTDDCATECGGDRQDPKPHVIKHINLINGNPEMQKLGVKAMLVENTFVAATDTREKYSLTIMDAGTGVDLAKIQGKYPGVKVKRISRSGIISVYEFDQPIADSAPADFQYEGAQILEQVCGSCPTGWTSVAGFDTYFVKRPLAGSETLTTDTLRDDYADTVGGEYATSTGATISDANKTFVGIDADRAVAIVKIVVPAGTATVAALKADSVELVGQQPAYCQAPAGATVAWVLGDTCTSGSRTLKIKLNRNECTLNADRQAEVVAALAGVKGVVTSGGNAVVTVIAGDSCVDEYTVVQNSDDCLDEACLTSNQTFTYDTPLPMIDGKAWEVLDPSITADPTRKVGIRITAGYYDPKFGNCSFDPYDYFEQMPIKMEVSLLKEELTGCKYINLPTQNKIKNARIARQSGEYVVREVIMKTEAYLKHVKQWDNDVRMREAFDMQLLNTVDRNAYYKLWYVTFYASYNKTSRTGTKEKFTTVVAVKEGDPNESLFVKNIIDVLSSKSGVVPHVNK